MKQQDVFLSLNHMAKIDESPVATSNPLATSNPHGAAVDSFSETINMCVDNDGLTFNDIQDVA